MDVGGAGGGSSNCAVEKEMEEVTDHDAQVADATDVDLKGSSAGSSVDGADVDHLAQESWRCLKECRRSWFVREIVRMTRLAVPSSFMVFTQQLFVILILLMVSHRLGSKDLDAVALGQSFSAVTGRSLIVGLSSAADTLCSQTYGFKNYKRVGIIFQRGVLILSVASFSVAAIWLVSDSIFLLLQQDLCVVEFSVQYLRLRILAIPFYLLFIMLVRYLQAQSLVWIFVGIGFIQNIAGVAFNSLFLYTSQLGVVGVALSQLVFDGLGPVLLIGYIKCRGLHKKTWGGWSWDSLRGWAQFLKLGVAGYLMIAFEWWAFEITTLVTGSIGQIQLAANTIVFQFLNVAYMVPFGYGAAAAIRVGNELGAGNPVAAKRVAFTGVVIELVITVAITIFFLTTRNVIGRVFTDDEAVLEILGPSILASLAAVATDQLQGVISGVLRGAGKQVLGAVTNFVCYYLIGLPLGICLALLANLGVVGIWIGISVADTLQTLAYFVYLLKFDWKKLSDQAVRNAGGKSEKEEDVEQEEQKELDDMEEIETVESNSQESPSSELEDSCLDESDIEEIESTAPLISDEEAEAGMEEGKKVGYGEERLTREHKMKLLLTKGSVIVVSCLVLLVGVVLAGVLRYDYSLCDSEDMDVHLSSPVPTPLHSTSRYSRSSVSLAYRTLPLPTPTPFSLVT